MIKSSLIKWNTKKLRLILTGFFLALAVPTANLVLHAYSQLKWESFYQHRLQAEELVKRINKKLSAIIAKEDARSFTDYSYLNITGKEKSVQRSPLARVPVNENIPGSIGYFQVDNQGKFSTPLIPIGNKKYIDTLDIENKSKRQDIHDQLYSILKENKLIQKKESRLVIDKSLTSDGQLASQPMSKPGQKPQFKSSSPVLNQAAPASEKASDEVSDLASGMAEAEPVQDEKVEESVSSQSAFDSLQTSKLNSADSQGEYSKSLGRVEDIKLKRKYAEAEKKKESASTLSNTLKKRSRRKEQNILPSPSIPGEIKNEQAGKPVPELNINMFESEIDTFELSLLKSGHFVLFRKVWRDNQRYIQGLLIDPDRFLNEMIRADFLDSSVSQASNLAIAFQGNILSAVSSKTYSRYFSSASEMQGTLLLQSRLSSPLEQLELIFSVRQLPDGPGANVINWLSIVLFIILCGGFYLLYRLGMKQIILARQQQDFVSAVSHELKTPLTSIRMYGEMLREGWATEEKRKDYYDYIYHESERLSRLINNVLQLARMTRNEIHTELRPLQVSQLIDTLHSKISTQAEQAGFTLDIQCNETAGNTSIEADEDYFAQVIINLVDNAIKFSSNSEKKQVDIHCQLISNKVVISIRDYGPGIQKSQMKKIFQLFYRTENELTRETVGTGIGLSLVKQLVDIMHGDIDILHREPGVEFQLSFKPLTGID